MKIEITKIAIIVRNEQLDYLLLHTELPNPCFPFTGKACFTLQTPSETGISWVKENFPGVEVVTVNI